MNHELIHRIECSVKVALKLSTEKVDDNDLVSYQARRKTSPVHGVDIRR